MDEHERLLRSRFPTNLQGVESPHIPDCAPVVTTANTALWADLQNQDLEGARLLRAADKLKALAFDVIVAEDPVARELFIQLFTQRIERLANKYAPRLNPYFDWSEAKSELIQQQWLFLFGGVGKNLSPIEKWLHSYSDRTPLPAFVYKSLEWFVQNTVKSRVWRFESLDTDHPDDTQGPDAFVNRTYVVQIRLHLAACLDELDSPLQAVIRLHYLDGRPLREMSEIMHKPIATTHGMLTRAREALRLRLEATGAFEEYRK